MIDFKKYDKENPEIWDAFVKYSKEAKYTKRFKNYSAKGIFEIIRWHSATSAKDGKFKLNNNFHADYARKMMSAYPDFKGFFRTRMIRAQRS